MEIIAFIIILFFVIVGCYYNHENNSTPYEKQMKASEKEQKKYYRLVNKAIDKYNKNKSLKEDELKALKRYINKELRDDPDNLSLLAVKQHIESEDMTNIDTKQYTFSEDEHITKIKNKNLSDVLNKYCECLTSKNYKYNPAIGREKEIEQLMMSILTPGKSAIVIGQPRSW